MAAPKARRILRITRVRNFFDFPRELRDVIYEHLLIEPILWERRHKSGCPFNEPLSSEQRPVFRSTYEALHGDYYRSSDGMDAWRFLDHAIADTCHGMCRKRKGLAVLRASKQVYQEANNILWTRNTFCYADVRHILSDHGEGIPQTIPHSAKSLIRRLCLVDEACDRFTWTSLADHEPLFNALKGMTALEELVLPPSVMTLSAAMLARLDLPRVPRISTTKFEPLAVLCEEPDGKLTRVHLYADFSKTVRMPDCYSRNHARLPTSPPNNDTRSECVSCRSHLKALEAELMQWGMPFTSGSDILSRAYRELYDMLEDNVPAQPKDGSQYKMRVKVEGDPAQVAVLLGLPIFSAVDRERQRQASRKAELHQQQVARTQAKVSMHRAEQAAFPTGLDHDDVEEPAVKPRMYGKGRRLRNPPIPLGRLSVHCEAGDDDKPE